MATVLIAAVDDNLGYVLRKELEDEGHTVGQMPPGGELPVYIAGHPSYDVVLIDLSTSCLTDLRSLSSIKKTCPHIHIIVFCDRVAPRERAALLTGGADRSFMRHEIGDLKEHLRQTFIVRRAEAGPPAQEEAEPYQP